MKNIAIITGGDSKEYKISLMSAETVYNNLDREKFLPYIIEIKNNIWKIKINDSYKIIEKDHLTIEINNEKIEFKDVFMSLHGPPAENGELQIILEKEEINYTCSNSEVSALTFNKYRCNQKLKKLGYHIADSYLYSKEEKLKIDHITSKFNFPLIIKPNQAGSSNGISLINTEDKIIYAIDTALQHDNQVLIEEYIKGTEISCGVLKINNEIILLPITEIISENDFFDYDAKYNNKSQEITPARIPKKQTELFHKITINIYHDLNLKGLCRIDYIIKKNKPYIIEINTIPGLSEESIIPKQLKEAGYNLKEIFTICLEN
jgi:D-alanine-D-alanine ligase